MPDDRTYLVTLRPDVRFHDGRPLTSADVVFTFRSFLDPAFTSGRKGAYRMVQAVDAVDPLTVRFTLKEPFASFPINWGCDRSGRARSRQPHCREAGPTCSSVCCRKRRVDCCASTATSRPASTRRVRRGARRHHRGSSFARAPSTVLTTCRRTRPLPRARAGAVTRSPGCTTYSGSPARFRCCATSASGRPSLRRRPGASSLPPRPAEESGHPAADLVCRRPTLGVRLRPGQGAGAARRGRLPRSGRGGPADAPAPHAEDVECRIRAPPGGGDTTGSQARRRRRRGALL